MLNSIIVAYFPPTPSWNNYIPQLWIYLCPLQIQFQYKILLPLVVSIRFQRASVNYANLIRFYLFIYQWSRTKLWDWFCWLAGCCVVIVHWENQYWESPSITLSHCRISWTYWPGISSWSGCGELVIDQDSWRVCYGIGGGDGACYKPINMVTSVLLYYGRMYSTVPVWPLVITHCGWFVSLYPHVVHSRFNGAQYDEFCDFAVSSKFSQELGVELPMSKGSVWLLRRRRKCA